jgi:hypothetical protein
MRGFADKPRVVVGEGAVAGELRGRFVAAQSRRARTQEKSRRRPLSRSRRAEFAAVDTAARVTGPFVCGMARWGRKNVRQIVDADSVRRAGGGHFVGRVAREGIQHGVCDLSAGVRSPGRASRGERPAEPVGEPSSNLPAGPGSGGRDQVEAVSGDRIRWRG